MITGASACELHGLDYAVATKRIDVLVPHRPPLSVPSTVKVSELDL